MKRLLLILSLIIPVAASAQNFVHLAKYEEQNAAVKDSPCVVVLIGDSITEGWVRHHGEYFNNGIIGRGISGEVSAQMLLRFRKDVVELHPALVVINAGTNDIALNQGDYNEDYTFGNIVSMAQLAVANGIRPILSSVLPAGSFRWRPEVTDGPEKIAALNARIRAWARENGFSYVDYHSSMLSQDGRSMIQSYSNDGVHPTPEGYLVMEALLNEVLRF